jgi:hypothetical protein
VLAKAANLRSVFTLVRTVVACWPAVVHLIWSISPRYQPLLCGLSRRLSGPRVVVTAHEVISYESPEK